MSKSGEAARTGNSENDWPGITVGTGGDQPSVAVANGAIPLPDHGKYGDPGFSGGAFYNYDRKYFGGAMLSDFRSPDYGNPDVIAEVAPKAKTRGMDFFCRDYNNESRRMRSYLDRLSATLFHDGAPKDLVQFYYEVMNYEEGPYETLNTSGLTADYVAREVKRARAATGPDVKLYPGIDVDVPTRQTDKRTKPDDVLHSVRAAFEAGADGVMLAREYVEMWLAKLSAAGETLREVFATR
jgi:hypothetical protein